MKKNFVYSLALLFSTFLLLSNSCEKDETVAIEAEVSKKDSVPEEPQEPTVEMDMLSYSFDGDYEDLWKKVDSLQNLGLYKSALETVQIIFDEASKEKNAPQVVKSVIHKMKYNSYMAEDEYVVAINELNSISQNAEFPLKQIIHSVTADVYWGFYQSNRWRFFQRTQTVNFENDDIRTWDLNTLSDQVIKNYVLSLANKDSLQHTNIEDFKSILISYEESDKQRPSLYDFLAYKALDFFENTEAGLTRPADKFIITGADYFGPADKFIKINTESKDSLSTKLYAVRILKDLTRFHKRDGSPEAMIDLELHRLRFAYAQSTESEKEKLYTDALQSLSQKYHDYEGYAEIQFYYAQYFNNKGSSYNPEMKDNQWDKKKAVEICEDAISRYPKSFGARQCEGLIQSIKTKSISFNNEKSYSPNTKGKMLIHYQNVDTLYFRVVEIGWDHYFQNRKYGEDLMKSFLKKKVIKEWTTTLPNPGDYQNHSTEIAIPELGLGQYAIIASPDKSFSLEDNAMAYGSFWTTNLSYIYRRNDDETFDVYVTDRETGEPIKGVKATVYLSKYSYVTRDYEVKRQESYHTDENGMFQIKSRSEYRYIYLDITYGDDRFNNANQLYQYRPYKRNDEYSTTHFFTDRSIYRPGQTIYFKGIRIHHDGNEHKIETGKQTTVTLYDANYQKVTDLKLTTNEYGTFSGTFTAPVGGLNGSMFIEDPYGRKYFSVEEYKRPKFEVEFEPIKGVYKIGEQISMTGTAKAFAGSHIDAADVKYRVTRSCHFPSWTWYRWGYYPYSQAVEIKNGELKTDENGEFIIEFNAEEDKSIEMKYYPYYTYTVTADVTDVNGETHSASQWVMVGYNAMNLTVGLGSTFELQEGNRFKVSTLNLNGEKVEAAGIITATKLKEPDGIFRSSLWGKPDFQEFTKEEYRKLFPHDEYDHEKDITKYERGKQVMQITFNTAENDSVDFTGMNQWAPGIYVIEATSKDAFGETVEDIRYITVLDKNSTKNATNDIWSFTALKDYCEPGENAEFLISSGAKDFKVLYEIEHQGKIIDKKILTLNKSQQKISIPIKEEYRGNIAVHFTAIKYGRSFTENHAVIVPYSNKELDITFETFRNKLLPGQKEEWRLKIKGPKGEKVAAEMLASMYDASLDEFASNSFYMQIYNSFFSNRYWYSDCFSQNYSQLYYNNWYPYYTIPYRQYDRLNWWGYYNYYYGNRYRNMEYLYDSYDADGRFDRGAVMADEVALEESEAMDMPISGEKMKSEMAANAVGGMDGYTYGWAEGDNNKEAEQTVSQTSTGAFTKNGQDKSGALRELSGIKARTNLNETAFFFPHLETNEEGEVIVKFTIPEALTKWKFLGMAHTKDLKTGYIQEEVVTQKELMVMPNAPRFLREGDKMTFTAKVSNLTKEDLNGNAQLMLFDATTMKPIDDLFGNNDALVEFTAKKGQSARLAWNINVPSGIGAVTYRVVAKAKNHTDGEENSLPILSNRMLVTESMPLPSKGIGTDNFTFTKLVNSNNSTSIKHHKLTLEYTSNPAWYAIQAMPYMMEYPYECSEQVFTRYYSNSLASNIVNSSPKIKNVFESWKMNSPEAFLSNLEKNQELKSLILEETPWVLDAQNESERKKRVALLFDLNKMDNELHRAIRKLQKLQVSNGGWPWFPGMKESRYITQHIITGMGHLDHLGVKNVRDQRSVWNMVTNGVNYLDQRIIEDYQWLKKHDPHYLTEQRISQIQVQYLYARSYFQDIPMSKALQEAFDYYQDQAKTYWKNFNLYNEGMIALQAKRYEIDELPGQIMASIKERAILHDELGMYWKDNVWGYYWYQAPIETQALLIEAFDEVTNDIESVEEMKVWLLKQKQTTDWKTTKATAEACYALLLRGTDLLANDEQVEIKVNNKLIDPKALGASVEAGTGYFKTSWAGNEIKPEMGNVSVTRKTEGVSWGAMYWQYFEDLDKITTHETPLKLNKKLFIVKNTESGEVITPITDETDLKPGDRVRVRIELRSDRDMEYVHMKDMRAAGFEPVNVFSRYKWQDGLGYYESTKDAATNFFMDYLPKGTYVFEYDLLVSHYGDFSNGITTIQCMYAPEFTSHSEGIRVKVTEIEK